MQYYKELGEPCRNFCFFSNILITDPKDGREKLVLSTFAAGNVGRIIFLDPEKNEGEQYELPGDSGAWALYCWKNERLLVGTCPRYGYLHAMDLKTRTWMEPLRDEIEYYIWSFAEGSDGNIYAGTYPSCVLLQYNPREHKLVNLGRVSDDPGDMYSRSVFADKHGRIYINLGCASYTISVWDIETKTYKPFGGKPEQVTDLTDNLLVTEFNRDRYNFYNVHTQELIESVRKDSISDLSAIKNNHVAEYIKKMTKTEYSDLIKGGLKPKRLKSGLSFGIFRGQEYYTIENNKLLIKKIPVEAPPTEIFALTYDGKGNLFGASGLGQTIFKYNIELGHYENTSMVCEHGGEVYGMRFVNDLLYLTAYSCGDHIVYDPEKPWDQVNNVNPKTIGSVGPAFIRPHARSVIGADNNIWTGWWAEYGTYGGCISRIDTGTNIVDSWPSYIEGQAINSIAAGKKYIYYTTGKNGNGLSTLDCIPYLVAINYDGSFAQKIDFPFGTRLGNILMINNKLLLFLNGKTIVYDEELNEVKSINVGSNMMLVYNEDTAIFFTNGKALFVNIEKGKVEKEYDIGKGYVSAAVVVDKDNVFYSKATKLYQLVLKTCY